MLDMELSPDLLKRIKDFNHDFLVLVTDIAKIDPHASVTLGMPQKTVDVLAEFSRRRIIELSECGVLLTKLRFDNEKFWLNVSEGNYDQNDVVHKILTEAK